MKILIVCGGGFSSSSLVNNLNREIERQGRENELSADFLFHMGFDDVDMTQYDVAMFCPHLRYQLEQLIDKFQLHELPCYVIPPRMYGMTQPGELIKDAESIVKLFKKDKRNPFFFDGEENILKVTRTHAYPISF